MLSATSSAGTLHSDQHRHFGQQARQLQRQVPRNRQRGRMVQPRASAQQAIRLPKPVLMEFVQQLERVGHAPSIGFAAREAADSTPEAPTFEATVTLSPELLDGLDSFQFVATAHSKKAAEHAAALEALRHLAAAGQLGRPLAIEVEVMQARAEAERALAARSVEPAAPQEEEVMRPTPEQLQRLQDALGYKFRDPELLRQACVHPGSTGEGNNDRLALLGDRVLDLIVLQQGMASRPAADNLELTAYKIDRVSRVACAHYAKQLGLGPCVRIPSNFRRSDGAEGPEDSMAAEAFEAVLGAMYQDAGGDGNALEVVRSIWEAHHPYEAVNREQEA